MKIKLTDAVCGSLDVPVGKAEVLVWDEVLPGLVMRVGQRRRAWAFVYRPAGAGRSSAPQKIGLGAWPALTVKAAREAARVEAGKIAKGEDPAAARREEKRAQLARLAGVLDDYEADLLRRGVAAAKTTMSTLRRNLSAYAARDVATLTRNEIVKRIEHLEAEGKPGAAGDLRKHTRTLLEWTTNRGLTLFNVLAGLRRPRETRAQRIEQAEYGRALSDDELRAVWLAADPETAFGRYIRGLALTGARRSEMSRLEWTMDKGDRLVLPSSHTKQGRAHEIPVTAELRAILAACPLVAGESGSASPKSGKTTRRLVFASPKSGGEMSGWTPLMKKLKAASGVNFTLHDLRRTMRSGLSRLGVDHDTAELAIGHQREDLIRRYNKDDRWPYRVEAAQLWANHVAGLAPPEDQSSSVMRLSAKRGGGR